MKVPALCLPLVAHPSCGERWVCFVRFLSNTGPQPADKFMECGHLWPHDRCVGTSMWSSRMSTSLLCRFCPASQPANGCTPHGREPPVALLLAGCCAESILDCTLQHKCENNQNLTGAVGDDVGACFILTPLPIEFPEKQKRISFNKGSQPPTVLRSPWIDLKGWSGFSYITRDITIITLILNKAPKQTTGDLKATKSSITIKLGLHLHGGDATGIGMSCLQRLGAASDMKRTMSAKQTIRPGARSALPITQIALDGNWELNGSEGKNAGARRRDQPVRGWMFVEETTWGVHLTSWSNLFGLNLQTAHPKVRRSGHVRRGCHFRCHSAACGK